MIVDCYIIILILVVWSVAGVALVLATDTTTSGTTRTCLTLLFGGPCVWVVTVYVLVTTARKPVFRHKGE